MLAVVAAFKAFFQTAKSNHVAYCRQVVENADKAEKEAKSKKDSKQLPYRHARMRVFFLETNIVTDIHQITSCIFMQTHV